MNISNLFKISTIFIAGLLALLLVLGIASWGGKGLYLAVVAVLVLAILYRVYKAWRSGRDATR